MQRRDISKVLLTSALGSALISERAQAQTCNEPCFPATQAEIAAGVTPSSYAYQPGDLRRYGAVGSGSDEANVINKALAANLLVTVPAGYTFATTGNHALLAGQTVAGPGTLKLHSGANPILRVTVADACVQGVKFDLSAGSSISRTAISIETNGTDVAIIGNSIIAGRIVTTGSGPSGVRIHGNTLVSAKVGGTSGGAISIDGGTLDFSVTDNTVSAADGAGIAILTNSMRGVVSGNLCRGNAGNGIFVDRGQYLTVSSNVCEANSQSGIGWNNASTLPRPQRSSLVGNICRGNEFDGIDIAVDNAVVRHIYLEVLGNHCEGNGTAQNGGAGINIQFVGLCTVSGNQLFGNATHGMILYGAELCTIQGNVCTANGNIAPGTYDGIRLAGARNCTVSGNVSTNTSGGANQRYGIAEEAAADGNIITGNMCVNNINAPGVLLVGGFSINANNRG